MAQETVTDIIGKGFKYDQRVVVEFIQQQVIGTIFATVGGANWGPLNTPTLISQGENQFLNTFGDPIDALDGADASGLAMQYHLKKSPLGWFTRISDGTDTSADTTLVIDAQGAKAVGTEESVNAKSFVLFETTETLGTAANSYFNKFKVSIDSVDHAAITVPASPAAADIESDTLTSLDSSNDGSGNYDVNDVIAFEVDGTTYSHVVAASDTFNLLEDELTANGGGSATYAEAWVAAAIAEIGAGLSTIISASSGKVVFSSETRGTASNIRFVSAPIIFATLPSQTVGTNTSAFDLAESLNTQLSALTPSASVYFDSLGRLVTASDSTGTTSNVTVKGIDNAITDEDAGDGDGTVNYTGTLTEVPIKSASAIAVTFDRVIAGPESLDAAPASGTTYTDTTGTAETPITPSSTFDLDIGGETITVTVDATGQFTNVSGTLTGKTIDNANSDMNLTTGILTIELATGAWSSETIAISDYYTTESNVSFTPDGTGYFDGTAVTEIDEATVNYTTGAISVTFAASYAPADGNPVLFDYTAEDENLTFYDGVGYTSLINETDTGINSVITGTFTAAYTGSEGNTIQIIIGERDDLPTLQIFFRDAIVADYFNYSYTKTDSDYIGTLINNDETLQEIVTFTEPTGTQQPFPVGTFTLSDGTSGVSNLADGAYNLELDKYLDISRYSFDIIAIPGNTAVVVADKLQEICETRQDCFTVVDPPFGMSVQGVIAWHNGEDAATRTTKLDSQYVSTYYPHMLINVDNATQPQQWHAPSVRVIGAISQNDGDLGHKFGAPAGLRTILDDVQSLETFLRQPDKDRLYGDSYKNNINPIVFTSANGYFIDGQKTTQKEQNSLNRINVMRTGLFIKKEIQRNIERFFWQPADPSTWAEFSELLNSIFTFLVDNRAIEDNYTVKCDRSTNTDNIIAANGMLAVAEWTPVKSVERIKVISTIKDRQVTVTFS